MSRLTQLGTASPLGIDLPDYVGQHFIDETNNVAYVAVGDTSADWQQIGAGGGFGKTGVHNVTIDGSTGSVVLDMGVSKPIIINASGTSLATLSLRYEDNDLGSTSALSGKMIVIAGDDGSGGNVTFRLEIADYPTELGNDVMFYTDEHTPDSSIHFVGGTSYKDIVLNNKKLILDYLIVSGSLYFTKIGQQ